MVEGTMGWDLPSCRAYLFFVAGPGIRRETLVCGQWYETEYKINWWLPCDCLNGTAGGFGRPARHQSRHANSPGFSEAKPHHDAGGGYGPQRPGQLQEAGSGV